MDCVEVEVTTTSCAPLRDQLMHCSLPALQAEARRLGVSVGVSRLRKHDLAAVLADNILSTGRESSDGRDARPIRPELDQARQRDRRDGAAQRWQDGAAARPDVPPAEEHRRDGGNDAVGLERGDAA
eukprot:2301906-Prymnesium_polylepis.2